MREKEAAETQDPKTHGRFACSHPPTTLLNQLRSPTNRRTLIHHLFQESDHCRHQVSKLFQVTLLRRNAARGWRRARFGGACWYQDRDSCLAFVGGAIFLLLLCTQSTRTSPAFCLLAREPLLACAPCAMKQSGLTSLPPSTYRAMQDGFQSGWPAA